MPSDSNSSQNSRTRWQTFFDFVLRLGESSLDAAAKKLGEILAKKAAQDGEESETDVGRPVKRPRDRWPKLEKDLRSMLNDVENQRLEKALKLTREAVTKSYTDGVVYGRRTPGDRAP